MPEQQRESSLKFQTRCVAAFSGAHSFAVASVEGRVAMEVLDPSPEAQEKKYAFKVCGVCAGGVVVGWHVWFVNPCFDCVMWTCQQQNPAKSGVLWSHAQQPATNHRRQPY